MMDLTTLMSGRGFVFTCLMGTGENAVYDFVTPDNVHCEICIKDESFILSYVTDSYHVLKAGKASPYTNDKHFKRLFTKFMVDVNKLRG
jgi:hypothetical protein